MDKTKKRTGRARTMRLIALLSPLVLPLIVIALSSGYSSLNAQDAVPAPPPAAEVTTTANAAAEPVTAPLDERLQNAVDAAHRGEKAMARDEYRHPYDTLAFFGIKPTMTVVEIWPGGGWYSDILAPYLSNGGKYVGASWAKDTKNDRIQKALKKYTEKFTGNQERYGKIEITELSKGKYAIGPDNSADMVLTFRNVHNWMKYGFEGNVFSAMFDVLKAGGILGVVEHREDPEAFQDPQALSGYVSEEAITSMAEDAGFKLVATSEINGNVNDTHNHPKGVWTLPPSLRLGEKDRDKYIAIGESDRATMKFIKPIAP